MSQILKLTHENQQLKRQISQYQQVLGVSPFVDDSLFKGGYRVVKTITDRDNIDCCHSKQGMIVCVIGEDLSFKEYRLISDCENKQWEEVQTQVTENDVILTEDYSELSEDLITQKDLNLILKQLILDLQTQIDNVELIDEKVQITETTDFAQIGQNQKDFNKNVSDYKGVVDSNIQGLQSALDGKLDKGSYQGTASDLKTEIDGKLNKPTTTSNTTSYPFVVGEDGNGNSARLPAGDLGKNFFNSDLSNTTARNHTMNAGVTINTLGNPYSITGLPNKNADVANFDNVVRYNPTTGQFAYGQAFVYNVPSTITVNHVNAPASPDVPSYIQAIQDKITEIHTTAVFQNFDNWTIETLNNLSHSGINVQNNKTVHTNISPFREIAGISGGQNVINIKTQRILPSNSNWAIKFDLLMATDSLGLYNQYGAAACRKIGIYSDEGSLINPDFYVRDAGGDHSHLITKLSGDNSQYISSREIGFGMSLRCLILKVNTQVLIQVSWGTRTISKIYDIQTLVNNNTSFGFLIDAYSLLDTRNPFDNYNALVDNIQYAILS